MNKLLLVTTQFLKETQVNFFFYKVQSSPATSDDVDKSRPRHQKECPDVV